MGHHLATSIFPRQCNRPLCHTSNKLCRIYHHSLWTYSCLFQISHRSTRQYHSHSRTRTYKEHGSILESRSTIGLIVQFHATIWWAEQDSNLQSNKGADLQSAGLTVHPSTHRNVIKKWLLAFGFTPMIGTFLSRHEEGPTSINGRRGRIRTCDTELMKFLPYLLATLPLTRQQTNRGFLLSARLPFRHQTTY